MSTKQHPTIKFMVAIALLTTFSPYAIAVDDQGSWQTTLQGRDLDGNILNGPEAYYDTVLNITWLADANYAKTSAYSVDGRMDWSAANNWVSSLKIYGISGWRLPTMVDTNWPGCDTDQGFNGGDCGYSVGINTYGSTHNYELAYLYHETLGNKSTFNGAGAFNPAGVLAKTGPFHNIQQGSYWYGLEYANNIDDAWGFAFRGGYQVNYSKSIGLYAWVVHSGDVVAVPEAQSWVLALAGLAITGGIMLKREKLRYP